MKYNVDNNKFHRLGYSTYLSMLKCQIIKQTIPKFFWEIFRMVCMWLNGYYGYYGDIDVK